MRRFVLMLRALLELPAAVAELATLLRDVRARLLDMFDWIRRPPSLPRVTVLVLWAPSEYSPGCASLSGELGSTIEFRADAYPIPAGAWVVGHGCELGHVFVGHQLQNGAGTLGCGAALRIADSLQLGAVMRVMTR